MLLFFGFSKFSLRAHSKYFANHMKQSKEDSAIAVWVVITAVGHPAYFSVAELSVLSVLKHTSFSILLGVDLDEAPAWADHPRITTVLLEPRYGTGKRLPFLAKFETLSYLTQIVDKGLVLQMDADALMVREIRRDMIESALCKYEYAMVEQKQIIGSNNDRAFFLEHYENHSMVWFDSSDAPEIDDFRFYNAGVVLFTIESLVRFLPWSNSVIESKPDHHRVGKHMIGDQDYLQFWVNNLNPQQCRELPWFWNHCEHWDAEFPRNGALICHFSNFCNGPAPDAWDRMSSLLERNNQDRQVFNAD
ncbi:MAG: hypothetical protein ACI9FD_004296 [Gammaproteobacteria bacterium]|jgi:hypothetical protein